MPGRKNTIQPRTEIGARLRHQRLARGLTLRQVAAHVGVSPARVRMIEIDRWQPTLATVARLCRVYDMAPAELLAGLPEWDNVSA